MPPNWTPINPIVNDTFTMGFILSWKRTRTAGESPGSEGSAAGGGRSDPSEWPRPRCSALPVADKAEHKCVPGSIADAAASSARKISGTPNGRQKQRSRTDGKAHTASPQQDTGTKKADTPLGYLLYCCCSYIQPTALLKSKRLFIFDSPHWFASLR